MRRKRRNHNPSFKAKVALAAIKGDRTVAVCKAGMLRLLCLVTSVVCVGGCGGRQLEVASSGSDDWRPVVLDTIPQLMAVELPLDIHMASERLRIEADARSRIALSDELVIAFESSSPVGLLGDSAESGAGIARQFSAYCSGVGETMLVYNLVTVGYRGCAAYSKRWTGEIVMDTECTSLGVFESTVPCR